MPCTYTLNLNGSEQTFASEQALRDYIQTNQSQLQSESDDIPETFEGQRDQFVDRWKLSPAIQHGQFGYVSNNGKTPTLTLAKRMATQLREKSAGIYDKLAIKYDGTYGLIHINPKARADWDTGPSYDIAEGEEVPKNPRAFQQLSSDFKMNATEESKYFLSPQSIKNDTYTNNGEYNNVSKLRTGNAQQLARHLGGNVESLRSKIAGSKLGKEYLSDFLAGKNTVKLSLYKVDRVVESEQFINPTEDQSIGALRLSKITQRNTLKRRIAQETDPHRKSELYKEYNRVIAQIKELNKSENQNIAYLKKSFLDDKALYATKTFDKASDVDRAYNLFNGYDVLFRGLDLKPFGEEVAAEFKEHLADIAQIKAEMAQQKNKISLQQMELKTGNTLSTEDGELLQVKDINNLAAYTLALSTTQNNPLLRFIGQTTNFAVNKAKDKTTQKDDEIKDALKSLREFGKTQGLKGVKLFNYMLEEDNEGKPTGHFVIKYGQFYNNLASTLKGKDPKATVSNFLKYIKENTESVTSLKDEFQQEWQKIYSSVLAKNKLASPDVDERSAAEQATLEANRIAYGIDPENFQKVLDKSRKGPLDDKDSAFIKTFLDRGGYYKFIKIQPKGEFRDKKFAHIDSLPADHPQKIFYNLFSELHYEVNNRIRVDEGATLRRNFIAEYKRDYKDDDESMFDYLKDSLHDWSLGMLAESPRDNIQGLDPLTKEITRVIPFYAFDGRIEPENKNYNLGKVLSMLAKQYYKYESLSEVEDDLLMAQHILKQTPVYETNSFGTPIMINGEPVIKKDTASMYKQADYHILATLYNERMKKDGVGGNKYYDADTARRIEELDKLAAANGELTAEDAEEYRKLKASYNSMTVKKATNALLYWTSMKNIGFNLFGGMAEIFQGTASLYLRYGGKAWFNTTFPTLLQLMNPTDSVAKSKLNNLKKSFHIESDPNPNVEESKFKKIAYGPYAIARTMANSGYLISVLKDQMIKDKEGKEHSLYDVLDFDQNGKFVLPANFDNPFYKPDGTFADYKYKLQQIVNKEIKQNRDRETDIDPIQMDQHFWGRLLGQFKASWLFEGFATRFGDEREGLNDLDKASKGIYRSFWDLSKVYTHSTNALGEEETSFSLPRTLLKAMINVVKYSTPGRVFGWGKQGDARQLDYEGAVRVVREVQASLFLYGMVMLVSGMAHGDDKDKWRKRGMTYLANYFMRTQRDMSSYFDPDSLMSIVNKNVIPSLSTVQEAVKLIGDPFHGLFGGSWYYNQGKSNEQFRITRDAADLVPLMNQLRMTINKAEKQQTIFY